MQITSFNPLIVTKDAEAAIALFEELGFERRHTKTGINDKDITSVRMRYTGEEGKVFHVDVTQAPVPQDITTIRMNIRDFDEAYKMLGEHGFHHQELKLFLIIMKRNSPFSIMICFHRLKAEAPVA